MEKYGTDQHPEHSDLSLPLANPIRRRIIRIVDDLISYRNSGKGCTQALIGSSEP